MEPSDVKPFSLGEAAELIERIKQKCMQAEIERRARLSTQPSLPPLFEQCPICKHPYASNFAGNEYILTGQPVCCGSPVLEQCRPTVYLCVAAPLSSVQVNVTGEDGKRYCGRAYAVREEDD